MAKYTQEVKELLTLIGGKENIAAVSHCMTRMRFVLTDEKKAKTKEIEQIKCVKGTFTQAGQYQVIIGNDVSTFYNEFTAYAGIAGGEDQSELDPEADEQFGRDLRSHHTGSDLRRPGAGLPQYHRRDPVF